MTSLDSILQEAEEYIRRDVATGFEDLAAMARSNAEVFAGQTDTEALVPELEAIVKRVVEERLREERDWPGETACDRLDRAFAALESVGIVARQHFSCCGNCGSAEIWDEVEKARAAGKRVRGYTFYHLQDTWAAVEGYGLCLSYGASERGERPALAIAAEIVDILRAHGFEPTWEGVLSKRIVLPIDWKRRLRSRPAAAKPAV